MKGAILFRYHTPNISRQISLLRKLNPRMQIHGLYGGSGTPKKEYLDTVYTLKHSPEWNWKNGDLAIMEWYKEIGSGLNFDMLYIVEWDFLMLAPISTLYSQISPGEIGLSGLRSIDKVKTKWMWTSKEPYKTEWGKLKQWCKANYGNQKGWACVFPGACFPRKFIDDYSRLNVPELCNDEVRVPLIAQCIGYEIKDTGFFQWSDKTNQFRIGKELSTLEVLYGLYKGKMVFHPFRKDLTLARRVMFWFAGWIKCMIFP